MRYTRADHARLVEVADTIMSKIKMAVDSEHFDSLYGESDRNSLRETVDGVVGRTIKRAFELNHAILDSLGGYSENEGDRDDATVQGGGAVDTELILGIDITLWRQAFAKRDTDGGKSSTD